MKMTYGEVPFPPCAARQYAADLKLIVTGPFEGTWWSHKFVASLWSNFTLLGWSWGHTPETARERLEFQCEHHLPRKEGVE